MRRVLDLGSIVAPVLVAGALALGTGRPGGAQEATPVAFPVTPDPALCRVEPRPPADYERYLAMPGATPAGGASPLARATAAPSLPPAGEAADAETVAAVAAFAAENFACYNAGDYPRAFALQTDAYLARSFAEFPPTAEDLAFFAAPPVPAPAGDRIELLALREVAVLADGRVGSFLDLAYPDGSRETQYGTLVLVDGGYRLDEVAFVPPPAGTPVP